MVWHEVSPIPVKRRARFSWHTGKAYTDPATKSDLQRMRDSWDGDFYPTEPLALIVEVFQRLPESKWRRMVREAFTLKPDVDNILKAVMDGLNGTAYADDKQITFVAVRKHDRTKDIEGEYIRYRLCPFEEVKSEIH